MVEIGDELRAEAHHCRYAVDRAIGRVADDDGRGGTR